LERGAIEDWRSRIISHFPEPQSPFILSTYNQRPRVNIKEGEREEK